MSETKFPFEHERTQPDPFPWRPEPPQPPGRPWWRRVLSIIKRPWFIVIMILFLIGTALALSINRVMITMLHSRAEVVVPKLEGQSILEALSVASDLDLSLRQSGVEFDESLPAGTIVRQHPPSGMRVRAGRTIQVVISKGGQIVFVPNIVDRPLQEAQSQLNTSGMQLGAVIELYSADLPKGTVISQNPKGGEILGRGALVDIEVSKGPPPPNLPLAPDFFGKTPEDVEAWANGLKADVKIKEDTSAIGVPGTVIHQEPRAGQPLFEEEDMSIIIVPPLKGGKQTRVQYQLPPDGEEYMVRLMARDEMGENPIYQGTHKAGDKLDLPISVRSTTRIRIYVNDELKEEQVLEP